MIPESEPTPVDDPDFPSGEWVGFYLQSGERYRQDLRLQFTDGRVSGSGDDNVGVFAIRGHYDAESLEVTWTKSYATHSVWYRGFREIKGIWGTWEIPEESGAEALVLVGENHRPKLHDMLDQFGAPCVCTYVSNPESSHPTVGFDNATAAAKLAQHLVHLGHRNICVISGITKDNDRTTKRLEGIKSELLRHSIQLRESMVTERPYSISDGRKACALLLSRNEPQPTAIVCGNDVLALGALAECHARGLRVPEDISIVGFDNLEFSMHSNPPLTTIHVPAEEMGMAAADYILGNLNGQTVSLHNPVEVELILRGSSAPTATGRHSEES